MAKYSFKDVGFHQTVTLYQTTATANTDPGDGFYTAIAAALPVGALVKRVYTASTGAVTLTETDLTDKTTDLLFLVAESGQKPDAYVKDGDGNVVGNIPYGNSKSVPTTAKKVVMYLVEANGQPDRGLVPRA